MKHCTYLLISLIAVTCTHAQKFGGEVLPITSHTYDTLTFSLGDTINLGWGSLPNGSFNFVQGFLKRGPMPYSFVPNADYSNTSAVVHHFIDYGRGPVLVLLGTMSDRKNKFFFTTPNLKSAILKEEILIGG